MRLGLITDIHCSAAALDIALERMGGQVDEVPCAGDAIFRLRSSNDVIRTLRYTHARVVPGNQEGSYNYIDSISPGTGTTQRGDRQVRHQ